MLVRFENHHLAALKIAMDTVDDNLVYEALNGIHFDFKNQRLLTSDRHRAFLCELPPYTDPEIMEPVTVVIKNPVTGAQVRKIPNTWKQVNFDFEKMVLSSAKGEYKLEKIDLSYPAESLDRIVKDALNAGYIKDIGTGVAFNVDFISGWKIGDVPSIGFAMIENSNKTIVVTFPNLPIDHIGIIMPMNYPPMSYKERVGSCVVY